MLRVLLVGDDSDVAETVKSVLQNFFPQSEVEYIPDGDGFRKGKWRKGPWDLVILDLMMPGITGFDACEQIRACPTTCSVPILALTGYDTLQNEDKIKAAGASGYMAKPFEIVNLKEEIQKLISK